MEVFKVIDAKSEAELVAAIAAGDEGAKAALFARYRRGVMIILTRAAGDPAAAEDLCQETFRITLQKVAAGEVREPEKLPAFIWSVAHRLALAYHRKQPARHEGGLQAILEVADPSPNQLEQMLQKERSDAIRGVLDEMASERDRQVLYRFYVAEEDKQNICDDLGLTTLQFNLVLFRARARYKELYEKRRGQAG